MSGNSITNMYMMWLSHQFIPFYIGTGIFGALFIILPCCVRKGPNQGIIQCSIMLSLFSMYMFWGTMYIAQMHPLIGPRHHNTTLLWFKYLQGARPVKKEISGEGVTDGTVHRGTPLVRKVTKKTTTRRPGPTAWWWILRLKNKLPSPDHPCHEQPDNVFECCNIPWLPDQARTRCINEPVNIVKITCQEARCAFRAASWIADDLTINTRAVAAFYDKLVVANRNWADAVQLIKVECLQTVPQHQSVYRDCPEYDVMYCAMVRMFKHGPIENWSTAAACAVTRDLVSACPLCPEQCGVLGGGWQVGLGCQACFTF